VLIIGTIVKLKPQWQDAGDDQLTFVVASLDKYPRISLKVREQSAMPIQPTYTVTEDMIQEQAQ
jgi:hypothetical protein